VPVDEAGVGLGLGAGVDDVVSPLHQVRAALLLEGGGGRESDVLGGQLVADIVGREVRSPGEQDRGREQGDGEDRAAGDQDAVDRAPLEGHDRLGGGRSGGGGSRGNHLRCR
jgi:hypothetical protein